MGSGEVNLEMIDSTQDMDAGMASGEVPEIGDMDVESPQDAENFVVADKSGNEVVMEKVIATQEKVVEQLKTLEPEQLVQATWLMGEALMKLGDLVENKIVDSAAVQESTAKDFVDPAASESADAQNSAAGSSDNAAAEAMVLLSKKTTEVPYESSSKHTPLPTQSLPQQFTTTITSSAPRKPQKGIVIREPAAQQKKIISSSSTDKGKGKQVENIHHYQLNHYHNNSQQQSHHQHQENLKKE